MFFFYLEIWSISGFSSISSSSSCLFFPPEKAAKGDSIRLCCIFFLHLSYLMVAWILFVCPGDTRRARARTLATRGRAG
jgi:hypothetical protein